MLRTVILLLCLACGSVAAAADPPLLTADAAHRQAQAGEIVLIDIRTPREWQQTGVPEGALALTMHTAKNTFYRRVLAAVGGDKTKRIALICAAGNRSRWASGFLRDKGFTSVADVSEGMFGNTARPGWRARGLPVVSWTP